MNDFRLDKKEQLRKEIQDKLCYLTSKDISLKSKIIFKKIIDNKKLIDHDTFMVFLSIQKEFDTKELIDFLLREKKKVLIPKVINETDMIAVDIGTLEEFSWRIDIVYVPWIVFWKDYNRIWRGKWYYDRFLKKNNVKIKVWIWFDIQLINSIYVSIHDEKMDMILTESSFIC